MRANYIYDSAANTYVALDPDIRLTKLSIEQLRARKIQLENELSQMPFSTTYLMLDNDLKYINLRLNEI